MSCPASKMPIAKPLPSFILCRLQHRPVYQKYLLALSLPPFATQLSFGTFKPFVRSKATQAKVKCTSTATETPRTITWMQLSSTHVKASTSGLRARPAKRPRMEMEEEREEEVRFSDIPSPHDSSSEPDDFVMEPTENRAMGASCDYNDKKYIVFESSLRELFQTCPVCKCACDVQQQRLGTFVSVGQICSHCQYSRKWQSQPVKGCTPLGNLQMSAAVYFSGGSFIQMEKICKALKLQIHRYETSRKHARMYLEPSIFHKWKTDQQATFQELQQHRETASIWSNMGASH
ncbi:uncharacterized protein [Leuresthes tenuis]|uniref:uncharacterized protein n=1 Tax=Leuresthes tenuis TaxID=355514 RepID=UPI003B507066